MNPHLAFTRQQRVYLGETDLTHAELVAAVRAVEEEWQAPSYNLLSRNCNHFCDALVARLLPGYGTTRTRALFWCMYPYDVTC